MEASVLSEVYRQETAATFTASHKKDKLALGTALPDDPLLPESPPVKNVSSSKKNLLSCLLFNS
jgi:hypothetical protein